MPFAQIVLGHPGCGKTTYTFAMRDLLKALNRNPILVNLDPANDPTNIDETYDIDVRDLIDLADVQSELNLGPNGALMFCLQFLASNLKWLFDKMKEYGDAYFIIDLPGQVELYTCHDALGFILNSLNKSGIILSIVHLIDCSIASSASNFVSLAILSLDCFFGISLPTVQLISKSDLLGKEVVFPGPLEHFILPNDSTFINEYLTKETGNGRQELNMKISELIADSMYLIYGLCSTVDRRTLLDVLFRIDEATGYIPYGDHKGIQWNSAERHKLLTEICEIHNDALQNYE